MDNRKRLSESDKKYIIENYEVVSYRQMSREIGFSVLTIRRYMAKKGLRLTKKMIGNKISKYSSIKYHFSEAENQKIRELSRTNTINGISEVLGVSWYRIKKQVDFLKVDVLRVQTTTAKQKKWIIKNHGKRSPASIAEAVGVSESFIRNFYRSRRLHIPKKFQKPKGPKKRL